MNETDTKLRSEEDNSFLSLSHFLTFFLSFLLFIEAHTNLLRVDQ